MSARKKLMQVRIALQATQIKQSGENKFAGYKYLQLDDFMPVAQKLCAEHGLCGVCSFDEKLATLTLTDVDDETSSVVITSPMGSAALKGCHEVQNVGAVETYQRRYLWVTALEIVEHDALDGGPPAEDDRPQRRAAWLDTQRKAIMGAANIGDLRKIVAGAIEVAVIENDSPAVDQINTWAEEKKAQAKPKDAK